MIRTRSRKEMLFARQTIVNAAVAYGLQSLDLASPLFLASFLECQLNNWDVIIRSASIIKIQKY